MLLVDDEPDLREVFAEFLSGHGFEVLQAANGLEALLQVKRQRPSHVVLDLAMPRLGGLEALKRIHAFDAAIAVIVVSSDLDPEIRRQALARGARAMLTKPVDLAVLLRTLTGSELPEPVASGAPEIATPAGALGQILVVDDDPDVVATFAEILTRKGYRVRVAGDGAAAVRAIAEQPPHVVLLDIDMPGLSGADALPAIRAIAPRAVVIMVSGTTDADVARRALAAGAFDFIMKPVDVPHLEESIETALAVRALEP